MKPTYIPENSDDCRDSKLPGVPSNEKVGRLEQIAQEPEQDRQVTQSGT